VTFLFTDIEGSTRLLQQLGEGYRAVQELHADIVRRALQAEHGRQVRTEGDSFFVAFSTPVEGLRTAVSSQRGLATKTWPHGRPLRVRMGLHTGEGALAGGDYIGIDVNRAARIAAAGHGGQILLSDTTRALVEDNLPEQVSLRSLGHHALKDFDEPRPLYDVVIAGLPDDFPPIRTLGGPRRANLPSPLTSFVGREREVAEIAGLLNRERLVTLIGPGGAGKTRLALRVAAELADQIGDGVTFVDLSTVTNPALVPSTIAKSLGVQEGPNQDPVEALIDHMGDLDALLVLDNFEQVLDAAALVARILHRAPRVRVLVTSRAPLHVAGEYRFLLGPLPLPDPGRLKLNELATSESMVLFEARARALRRDFQLTEENGADVAEIVRRLDGLPLAIELAASRINVLSPRALRERLDGRLGLLTGGPRDRPERQRTLRGAIEWSHDLLEPDQQRLFARLAVFRGGWTLASAEAVCGFGLGMDMLDGLASLLDRSLIRQDATSEADLRYGMLETIHEFAGERLAASGELEEILRRHAEHIRDLAEEAEPHFMREGQARWLARLESEHDNLRAALDWAESAPDNATALRTTSAVWRFWQQRGHLAEARAQLERALSLPGAQSLNALRVRALGALGGVAYWQGDYEGIRGPYEQAVEIAREIGDRRLLSRALFDLSFLPGITDGDFEREKLLLEEALAESADDDRVLHAQIWSSLGYLQAFRGDGVAVGIRSVERALAIHRELGDRLPTAETLLGLAGLRLQSGESDAARSLLEEALEILLEPQSPVMVGMALAALTILANWEGDETRAARLLGASARIKDEGAGAPPPIASVFFGDPEATARVALGEEAFERAHAEGYAMTLSQARSYAVELSKLDA
jgi:predicted ATPase/class 3 adenylate cyclase